MNRASSRRRFYDQAYLLLTLAVLFWAGNFVLGRAVRAEIPPVGLAFWRWLVATLLLWPFAWPRLRRELPEARRRFPILTLLALLGVGSFNTLVYSGLQRTSALNASLLQSLMPILVALFSDFLFQDRVTPRQLFGILLSFSGAVLILFEGRLGAILAFRLNPGDLLVVLAVVCYALYTALLRLRPGLHPLSFLLVTFGLGTLMILPFYLWESLSGRAVTLNVPTLASVLYVAIFPSILSYFFYNRGVALIGANRAGLFAHLMPLFGSLLAVLLLGEVFGLHHALGMALILAGIGLATLPGGSSRATLEGG